MELNMLFIISSFLVLTAGYPQATIDPSVLVEIFGTPPTTTTGGDKKLEDITIKPTEAATYLTDSNGNQCKCVPYYLCDKDLNGNEISNASVTGWGMLDIRFGEEDCQETVERCCTEPDTVNKYPAPKPDPKLLKQCGYRNPNGLDFQITGGNGNEAQFGEFPWVIALLDALNGSYVGVGVLIHPQVVMTGAHIAAAFAPGTLKVRAGEWDTQTNKERLEAQERLVSEIVIRNDFNPKSLRNDLALLRLDKPFELADHINVICMPENMQEFENNKNCIANGWGKNVFGKKGHYAVILKKVEIDMVPFHQCNAQLKQTRLGKRFELHKSFVCAGGQPGKDTCKGDGGAPLACPIAPDRYTLAGLVAWGIGCGDEIPAVYARVSLFRRWVDERMGAWGYDTNVYSV
ncbi:phenoloxidase-activating factor 2-like isoform X2 [Colias croceus]|uniref:phenoloxidase-activating factor 2-like isoform X1 n=1 Tax=Colias crocea TaxID=72248 RepID=UPI001E27C219|nr:phenoloxidase-activating factor 2-like isoform X1 [Colias croceus]XP_045506056.1 phenoloxidase-activating factor 2-like isoform X2 [Colias croceus]